MGIDYSVQAGFGFVVEREDGNDFLKRISRATGKNFYDEHEDELINPNTEVLKDAGFPGLMVVQRPSMDLENDAWCVFIIESYVEFDPHEGPPIHCFPADGVDEGRVEDMIRLQALVNVPDAQIGWQTIVSAS